MKKREAEGIREDDVKVDGQGSEAGGERDFEIDAFLVDSYVFCMSVDRELTEPRRATQGIGKGNSSRKMGVLRGSSTGRGRRWNQTEEQKEKEDWGQEDAINSIRHWKQAT